MKPKNKKPINAKIEEALKKKGFTLVTNEHVKKYERDDCSIIFYINDEGSYSISSHWYSLSTGDATYGDEEKILKFINNKV